MFYKLKALIKGRVSFHVEQIGKIAIDNPNHLTNNPEYRRHLKDFRTFKTLLEQADQIEINNQS